MKTVTMKVSELSQDPANARKHDDRNIDSIIASLRRFGQQKPIVIDASNVVRAGNGTLEAAKRLGWDSIDCVETSLKGSDAIAYAIADNRTAELAEWDSDTLAAQLSGLLTDDEELANAAGFSAEEIEAMLTQEIPDEESQVDLSSKWEIVVTCESEADQQKVFEMIEKEGYKCRVLTF
jgi:ParB-like chromosome segregation protein Spo0J